MPSGDLGVLALRMVGATIAALLAMVAFAPNALADAAGPTDYNTEIVSVEPANTPIEVEMIGGDAFLSVTQLEPVEIIVLGYRAEPYLRFAPDGTVYENRRSPAVWQNEDRYGTEQELPSFVDHEARPEWSEVASGGVYAWHDHRSHWMQPQPPPSSEPGDQVIESVVPLRIDGTEVSITVASFLLAPPSNLPAVGGLALALAAVAATWNKARLARALVGLLAAGAAGLLGTIAFSSVPAVTGPSPMLWLLPAVAGAALLLMVVLRRRLATTVYLDGLIVAAGAALAGWAFTRIDALQRSLIPTTAPESLDRFVIALCFVVGLLLAATGIYGLLRPQRLQPIGRGT